MSRSPKVYSQITKLADDLFAWLQPTETAVNMHYNTIQRRSDLTTQEEADGGGQTTTSKSSVMGGISNGAKIGMIVSIVVVVILFFFVLGFCAFDGRRRIQKWRENRHVNKHQEIHLQGTELRDGHTVGREVKPGGLWGGLRGDREAKLAEGDSSSGTDATIETYERRLRSVGMLDKDTETNDPSVKPDEAIGVKKDSDYSWLPANIPRERASLVSTVGSLGTPVVGPPVVAKSFLEKTERR